MVCFNEEFCSEVDMVYRRISRGKRQHFAQPSEVVSKDRLRFFGYIMRRPSHHFAQVVLKMLPDNNWERSPGRKRTFWTKVVKEDLRTLGVNRQFSRDVKFRRLRNSEEWVDSMRILAENRTGRDRIYSMTTHPGEDAGSRVRP
ncbi:hypothetical protein RB195_003757 [Necator americanus]|uniref:Uncharacterized protein n=1 Tax=Necator americanus TaxID=51031 RepID=A0ABR1DQ30_NECAM